MRSDESAEDYLETILALDRKTGAVRSVDVANELGFSKPSVSVAVRKLRERGFVQVAEDGTIKLTESGAAAAESVTERHAVITELLVSMGVTRKTAEEDACRIEHVISRESFAAIKTMVTKR